MNLNPSDLHWKTLFSGNPADGWLHSGIGVLSDGQIVFEAPGGRAFIILNPEDGSHKKVTAPAAVLHGITVHKNSDSFWICDPGVYGIDGEGQIIRVNRDGEILQELIRPNTSKGDFVTWKPTSLAIVEVEGEQNGDIWVGDGYGESLVHRIRRDGTTQTFDGSSTGTKFDCPHGVTIDTRGAEPLVAIADRGNERLVFFTLDGEFVREVKSENMEGPSSIAVRGDDLVITDLFGAILALDMNDQIEILISSTNPTRGEGWPNQMVNGSEVAPIVHDGAVNSPHGITVGANGKVFFTEWYFGGRVVQIL